MKLYKGIIINNGTVVADCTFNTYGTAWSWTKDMLDDGNIDGYAIVRTQHVFALCANRHNMPVDEAIFDSELDPLDTEGLYEKANNMIPEDCDDLTVYVTGLSVAMLAVVRVCCERHITLMAMHFDRNTGEYYDQTVLPLNMK